MASNPPAVIFLPGILMPAELRFAPLIRELGPAVVAINKELDVYREDRPPEGYSIDLEVAGLDRAADEAGLERFHLYGHSAGGAIALAYAARHPERVLSLALDEPASDFSEPDRREVAEVASASVQGPAVFLRMQLAPGVEPPPPPQEPAPPWMSKRLAGISAFSKALVEHRVGPDAWRRFSARVYFSHGSLSHPRWQVMRDRLAAEFPDFRSELFEGLHHLRPCHQTDPARAAASLRSFWAV